MSKNKNQPMYKVVIKETIKLFLSQFVMLLLVAICYVLPLFFEIPILSEKNAVIGLIITAAIIILKIWGVVKGEYYAYRIYRFMVDSMNQPLFYIYNALEADVYSEDTADNIKEVFRKTEKAFINYSSVYYYLKFFNLGVILVMLGLIIYPQVVNHKLIFYYFYGIGDFFLIISILCAHISARFIFSAEHAWYKRFNYRIINDFNKAKENKEKIYE